MGIKEFNPTLKKKNPALFHTMHMKELTGKKFAIDISIFINKFAMTNQETWLNQLTYFLLSFIKHNIEAIIIFDGQNVPPEKLDERENRKSNQQKSKVREENLSHLKEKLEMTCFDGENAKLVPESLQEEVKKLVRFAKGEQVNLKDPDDVLLFLTKKLHKAEQAAEGITKRHKELTRSLVKAMGFKYIQADGEAEALAASMAYHGLVDGVFSRDTDTLCYKCPLLVFDIKQSMATVMYLSEILETLDMTMKQFRDLCICLGCDYNHRMNKKGPAKILEALAKWGSIEGWKEAQPDLPFHELKWKRCREIFRPYSKKYLQEKCNITQREKNVTVLNEIFEEVSSRYTGEYVISALNGKANIVLMGNSSNILGDVEENE